MPKNTKQRKRLPKQRRPTLKGYGDYEITKYPEAVAAVHDMDKRLVKLENKKGLGAGIGSKIGGMLGNAALGDSLGGMAENSLAKLFGFGDYHISSNSLMKAAMNPSSSVVPTFGTHSRGVRITEREYIGEITSGALSAGSSVFTNQIYNLNPADTVTFPWLSQFAQNFEQWVPHGIVFEFVSTSSEYNGTSQALGTVIMATDYDPYDTSYASKVEMETAAYSNSTKPSNGAMHGIECDPKERSIETLYVGTTAQGDLRMQTLGNFQIATQGMSTSNVPLGELWVSYDFTFFKKQANIPVQYLELAWNSGDGFNIFSVQYAAALTPPYSNIQRGLKLKDGKTTFPGNTVSLDPLTFVPGGYYSFTFTIEGLNVGNVNWFTAINDIALRNATSTLSGSIGRLIQTGLILVTGPNPSFTVNAPTAVQSAAYIKLFKVPPSSWY